MKNKKTLLATSAIAAVSIGIALTGVSAQEAAAAKPEKVAETQAVKENGQNSKAVKSQEKTSAKGEKNEVVVQGEEVVGSEEVVAVESEVKKDKKIENKGQLNAQAHRSAVATFVKSLLAVAEREGGIGQQVKVIAQQKEQAEEQIVASVEAVETRGKLKTFFLGTDYKNLGQLRKQNVQTRNQIAQLSRLIEKAETEEGKLALQAQIDALNLQKASMDAFIAQNESKFSLLGWASKLLSGYKAEAPAIEEEVVLPVATADPVTEAVQVVTEPVVE